jgi:hypothetical protein
MPKSRYFYAALIAPLWMNGEGVIWVFINKIEVFIWNWQSQYTFQMNTTVSRPKR